MMKNDSSFQLGEGMSLSRQGGMRESELHITLKAYLALALHLIGQKRLWPGEKGKLWTGSFLCPFKNHSKCLQQGLAMKTGRRGHGIGVHVDSTGSGDSGGWRGGEEGAWALRETKS